MIVVDLSSEDERTRKWREVSEWIGHDPVLVDSVVLLTPGPDGDKEYVLERGDQDIDEWIDRLWNEWVNFGVLAKKKDGDR